MMSMITAVVTMMMFKAVLGYQAGAPASACDSMTPSHDGNLAQSSSFPNTITASASTYRCGETITVTLGGGTNFKGFLCQARTDVADATTRVGTLTAAGSVTMTNNCDSGKALTHTENGDKSTAVFTWQPSADHGSVYFVCTVVQSKAMFWVKGTSTAVTYGGGDCSSSGNVAVSIWLLLLAAVLHILLQ